MELWTAFTIGLLGSMHCIGMCGPIAFALPLNRNSAFSIYTGSLVYNFGRLATYFIVGILFGIIGFGFAWAGFQQVLSIAVGIGMVLSIVLPFIIKKSSTGYNRWNILVSRVKSSLAKRFGNTSLVNLFSIGLLNGLLPCGLVYLALAGATAMANPFNGGMFMLFFGLGTLPLMMSVAVLGNTVKFGLKAKIRKATPVFIVLIGCLFILRGMNLGIPYISPEIIVESAEAIKCH